MPRYDQYQKEVQAGDLPQPLKIINLGDSGTAKSGALAALANLGYRVFIADFDVGTHILNEYLTPEGAARLYFKTFTDEMISDGLFTWPKGMPQAWMKGMMEIQTWREKIDGKMVNLGGVNDWGQTDVLAIDSLTFMSRAAMRYEMFMDMGQTTNTATDREKMLRWLHPFPRDFGGAQNRIEKFFELIYSKGVNCNVVVSAHVRKLGGGGKQLVKDKETGVTYMREMDSEIEGKGYPVTVGRALSPHLARYFNTVVMSTCEGEGEGAKRWINTVPIDNTPLKCEAPSKVKSRILIDGGNPDSGLAKLFKLLRPHQLEALKNAGRGT